MRQVRFLAFVSVRLLVCPFVNSDMPVTDSNCRIAHYFHTSFRIDTTGDAMLMSITVLILL